MGSAVAKLIETYSLRVSPARKEDVYAELDKVRARVEAMEELTEFPEGAVGVVLYTLLRNAADECPDAGDFGLFCNEYRTVLKESCRVLADEINEHWTRARRSDKLGFAIEGEQFAGIDADTCAGCRQMRELVENSGEPWVHIDGHDEPCEMVTRHWCEMCVRQKDDYHEAAWFHAMRDEYLCLGHLRRRLDPNA
jgi:hypothetical protein